MKISIKEYEQQELKFLNGRLLSNNELLSACYRNTAISSKTIVLLLEQGKSLKARIDQLKLNLSLFG